MILRRKDYTKHAPSKDARKIYIISEGTESEIKYLNFFTGLSSNLELIVIPSENGTDPMKLMELALRKFDKETGQFTLEFSQKDQIWFVIDTDTWEREGKIDPLRTFCTRQNDKIPKDYDEVKRYDAWNIAQSNPSFEVWLYYHFYDSIPDPDILSSTPNIKGYVDSLIAGGFDYESDPAKIHSAIDRAKKNFRLDEKGKLMWFATEFFKLGMEIEKFTASETRKLLGKLSSEHLPLK